MNCTCMGGKTCVAVGGAAGVTDHGQQQGMGDAGGKSRPKSIGQSLHIASNLFNQGPRAAQTGEYADSVGNDEGGNSIPE
jgi:hypothetical protein